MNQQRTNTIKEIKKGSGWHEHAEEVVTKTGVKKVAPRHREVAIRESLKDTERTPMAEPGKTTKPAGVDIDVEEEEKEATKESEDDVPLLPAISDEQAKKDEIIKFNFGVPSSKTEWLKRFAEKNHLEVTIEGTCGHVEIIESYFRGFMEVTADFEDLFEKECRAEREKADSRDDEEEDGE